MKIKILKRKGALGDMIMIKPIVERFECSKSLFFILVLCAFHFDKSFSQIVPNISLESMIQSGNSEQTPFWFISNQYGKYSKNKDQAYMRFSVISKQDTSNVSFLYGVDLINKIDNGYNLTLHQSYIGMKLWKVNLYGGLKESTYNNRSEISTGGIIFSGNSNPIPVICLDIRDYQSIPYTWKILETKFTYLHGWLKTEADQYVENAFLHYKNLFFRINIKENFKVYAGMHHAVQWGGISPIDSIGKIPSNFKEYLNVVFKRKTHSGYIYERINQPGNHLGSYNIGIEFSNSRFYSTIAWYSIFDDGSGQRLKNLPDGLYEINFSHHFNTNFNYELLYEYFYSVNQSGVSHDDEIGNDNYYNHYIYRAWSYNNLGIGNPLITSPALLNSKVFINNKVKASHIGIKLNYKNQSLKILNTISKNFGVNGIEFKKDQYSFLLDYNVFIPKFYSSNVGFDFAFDNGELFDNSYGIRLKYKRTF